MTASRGREPVETTRDLCHIAKRCSKVTLNPSMLESSTNARDRRKPRPAAGAEPHMTAAIREMTAALGIDPAAPPGATLKSKDLGRLLGDAFSREEIEEIVAPRRTLARRASRDEGLTTAEIDRALRLARIRLQALRTFGAAEKADRWLRKPSPALSSQTPLTLLKTETGAQKVQEIMGQIAHGIFM
jgi:putative toxin-antitoxin system antitoxin component (TIGR02293 family)